MKFNCDKPDWREEWHTIWPIIPVKVGPNDCRAFETVYRKGKWVIEDDGPTYGDHFEGWEWEYMSVEAYKEMNVQ